MPSRSETGHDVNRANFDGLYELTGVLGAHYQPSNEQLKRTALAQKAVEARDALDRAEAARRAYTEAVDRRAEAFKGYGPLCTRLMKSLRSSGAPAGTVAKAESLNKKMQGTRATPAPKAVDGQEAAQARSVSQQSYDMLQETFGKLVAFLAETPAYAPAETELSVATLRARHHAMKAANTGIVPLEAALTEAILRRDMILYGPGTGIVDTARAVKAYIGSLDKAKVPAAAEAAKFIFRSEMRRLEKAGLA
ncbi:hypothetical protein [Flaviaesturariibacter terrae]